MITVNLFTSGKHTQGLIKTLKHDPKIKLLKVYQKLNQTGPADVFLVADFGYLMPKKIYELPKHGTLVVHPSLLPQYRGAMPVPFAIMNGDRVTGVSIIKIDEEIDHGPIIAQFKEEIRDNDTGDGLCERLFTASGQVLTTILPAWIEGKIKPREQVHSQATFTRRLTRDDGRVDWQKTDQEIERFIRAMSFWPGAWTMIKAKPNEPEKRLKILKAHLEKGKLVLDQVQLEGKKPVTWKQFQEGYPETEIV